MPLPSVLQVGLEPLVPTPRRISTMSAEAERSREIVRYVGERQQYDQWCWAAVARSVAQFYDSATKWTSQCVIANAALQRTDCCSDPERPECNRWWYLDSVLALTGNLKRFVHEAKAFEEVVREIDDNRPIGARVGWSGGGGHFVVITGYDYGKASFILKDPWYGDSIVSADVFRNAYQGTGTWTHAYETQPAPPDASTKRRSVRK